LDLPPPIKNVFYAIQEKHRLSAELLDELAPEDLTVPPRPFMAKPRSEVFRSLVCV
jgi:hypothetical protein